MIAFYLLYPFLLLISILPFPILYLFSDFLYLIIYYMVGYRKKIVQLNLKNSFPNKSEIELKKIEKKFYKHLCDLILETIKGYTISEKQLRKRMVNKSTELYAKYDNEKRNVIVVMSHNGNWEWVCLIAEISVPQKAMCIYKTLSNKYFDKWMLNMRSKFGTSPITMEKSMRVMAEEKSTCATAFIGDQNPSNTKNCVWVNFLNQDTAFLAGTERIAQKLDQSVLYLKIRKIKRGYYECFTETICDDVKNKKPGEITQLIAQKTEEDILEQPALWLWSHRRWKHKRK